MGPVLFSVMVNDLVQSWGTRIKFVDDLTVLEVVPRNSPSLLNVAVDDIHAFAVFPLPLSPPPPHLYCFPSTTTTTATFLLFSLHHHHHHHISIVFPPPPPPPPPHFYCFPFFSSSTFLLFLLLLLISIVFPQKDQKAKIRPKAP